MITKYKISSNSYQVQCFSNCTYGHKFDKYVYDSTWIIHDFVEILHQTMGCNG